MTSYPTTKINSAGDWLRSDAAASYFRMLADGMPAGGIDVFGRTMQQQWDVYNAYREHRGPLAAYPNVNAPHIKGLAMDFHTTKPITKAYDPSAAFLWATRGTDGSKAPRDTNDAKMFAHKYGWYRTVPGERWHLGYDPAKDQTAAADWERRIGALGYATLKDFQRAHQLDPDGVVGPLTWGALLNNPTPKPVEPPVPTPQAAMRGASLNMQAKRWGGGKYINDAKFVRDVLKPTFLMTQESEEIARDSVHEVTGMARFGFNYLGLFWDDAVYTHGVRETVSFGTPYHGALATTLSTDKVSFAACSTHIRPRDAFKTAAAAATGKKADIAKVIKLLAPHKNAIVAGDFSSDAKAQFEAAGYRMATPHVDTYDKAGDQRIDGMFYKGAIEVVNGKVVPTDTSDHHGLVAEFKAGILEG